MSNCFSCGNDPCLNFLQKAQIKTLISQPDFVIRYLIDPDIVLGVQDLGVGGQAQPVPRVPNALLGLLPVTAHVGPLLVDGLLDNRLLVISNLRMLSSQNAAR